MIPKPRTFEPLAQIFDLTQPLAVAVTGSSPALRQVGSMLIEDLAAVGAQAEWAEAGGGRPVLQLSVGVPGLGKEEFRMVTKPSGVVVEAGSPAGAFYATRTLLTAAGGAGRMPCGVIEDGPRYSWRGAHLDVARHFYSVESVKRFIDLIALHKMNVFHWHLTEDQGWRIQIDAFPKLTEVSAFRKSEQGQYGGFYTKDEVREVVAYAEARFITVVPEIEMPGHAVAALAAYPELSCSGGPFEVETEWGIFDDVYCVGNDKTIEFLEKVLDEVIELFPGDFFHIGGDECPKKRWKTCEKCQATIEREKLSGEDELQSWFVCRMSDYLSRRGKRLVGWDEILEGGLAPGATVMSWRGTEGGVRAAQMNHDVVMSPTTHCYLDYKQTPDEDEPGAWFAPDLSLETVYSYEPTPAELTEEQAAHVLGVQGNVWTEKMPTFKHVEYMVFPRLCALSEVAWSGPERDYKDFLLRLKEHQLVLDRLDVGYRGAAQAQPAQPSEEDRARYAKAKRDREGAQAVAAY
jgi:hexosaminidase